MLPADAARDSRRLHVTWPVALLAAALAMMPLAASAFDDEREGIVLGAGAGLAPVARWSTEFSSEDKFGAALQFFAGYAWNERDMIGLEGNAALYHSAHFNADSLLDSGDMLTWQGFQGAAWYHYWGQPARILFTVVGLGLYDFDRGRGYHSDPGGAWLLGAGYQFTRHLQAGVYFAAGRTYDEGPDATHRHLSLLLSHMAF